MRLVRGIFWRNGVFGPIVGPYTEGYDIQQSENDTSIELANWYVFGKIIDYKKIIAFSIFMY
jgi:hypothetical protein